MFEVNKMCRFFTAFLAGFWILPLTGFGGSFVFKALKEYFYSFESVKSILC